MNVISPVEVLSKAHVDHNMDPKVFCSHIDIAEAKLKDPDGCFGIEFFEALEADLQPFTDYVSTATYAQDDIVLYNGKYYKCKNNGTTNILPTVTASWDLTTKFTTAKYQTLWDKHLWQILALMVQHTSTFTNSIRTTAQGEMINSTGNSEGANYQSVKAKKEELSDNIKVLNRAMDYFLRKQKDDYPLYPGNKSCGTKCNTKPDLGVYLKRKKC